MTDFDPGTQLGAGSSPIVEGPEETTTPLDSVPLANLLGVGVHAIDMPRTVAIMCQAIVHRRKGYICLMSAHGIIEARRDKSFQKVAANAFLVLPDGMPAVWMGHHQGFAEMQRVFGPELMEVILGREDLSHLRHFFCGGAPGVADRLRAVMVQRYPSVQVCGTFSPPFEPMTPEQDFDFIQQVRAAQPDILWVGISTPKQDHFMHRYLPLLDTTLMVGVGAAFLFHVGAIHDSPAWVKRSGLQWLHRLIQEPSRLWRRYAITVPLFVFHAGLQLIGLKRYSLNPASVFRSRPTNRPTTTR